MSLGGYPMGAEYDRNAPWNQKEPRMVECPACGGKGHHWYAYNIRENRQTECKELVWGMLPETEEEAEAKGENFCQGEVEVCEVCDGEGEIEDDTDYEPDPDDYYEQLRERRYDE